MTSLVVHFCSAPLVCFVDALDTFMLNFDSRMSVGQSAHMAHFISADYIHRWIRVKVAILGVLLSRLDIKASSLDYQI